MGSLSLSGTPLDSDGGGVGRGARPLTNSRATVARYAVVWRPPAIPTAALCDRKCDRWQPASLYSTAITGRPSRHADATEVPSPSAEASVAPRARAVAARVRAVNDGSTCHTV